VGKVQLLLWINEELDTRFRKLIQQKYSKFERGILSYEGEMALRHWLSIHTGAQSSLNIITLPNPTPKVGLAFAQIKEYLLSNYYYELSPGQQVTTAHLKRAIENTRGSDPRTINKWLKTFHKNGLIKPVTSATWEVI